MFLLLLLLLFQLLPPLLLLFFMMLLWLFLFSCCCCCSCCCQCQLLLQLLFLMFSLLLSLAVLLVHAVTLVHSFLFFSMRVHYFSVSASCLFFPAPLSSSLLFLSLFTFFHSFLLFIYCFLSFGIFPFPRRSCQRKARQSLHSISSCQNGNTFFSFLYVQTVRCSYASMMIWSDTFWFISVSVKIVTSLVKRSSTMTVSCCHELYLCQAEHLTQFCFLLSCALLEPQHLTSFYQILQQLSFICSPIIHSSIFESKTIFCSSSLPFYKWKWVSPDHITIRSGSSNFSISLPLLFRFH